MPPNVNATISYGERIHDVSVALPRDDSFCTVFWRRLGGQPGRFGLAGPSEVASSTTARPSPTVVYCNQLYNKLEQQIQFRTADVTDFPGKMVVYLEFEIAPTGKIFSETITRSSGNSRFDQLVMNSELLAKLPSFLPGMQQRPLKFVVPISSNFQ